MCSKWWLYTYFCACAVDWTVSVPENTTHAVSSPVWMCGVCTCSQRWTWPVLLLMTASGSIILSVESTRNIQTNDKSWRAWKQGFTQWLCCSQPFLVIKFYFRLSQIHATYGACTWTNAIKCLSFGMVCSLKTSQLGGSTKLPRKASLRNCGLW